MFSILYLLALTHYYTGKTENNIRNTCDFDILRIKKHSFGTYCIDYGEHVKYCHHYLQPEEFIITNEKGLNESNIIIRPNALWQEAIYDKYKMANYYYTFTCDNKYNSPRLIQHIVPTEQYDIHSIHIVIRIIIKLMIFTILISFIHSLIN